MSLRKKLFILAGTLFTLFVISCEAFAPDEGSNTSTNGNNSNGTIPKNFVDTGGPAIDKELKRGMCYNLLNEAEIKVLADSDVSWVYNWATHPDAATDALLTKYGIEFIPMQWGLSNANSLAELRAYYTAHPKCKYLLAYNEPNLGAGVGGSGITPAAAANDYPNLEKIAEEFDLYLVGPALQYSGEKLSDGKTYSTPKLWMDAFIEAYKKKWKKEPRYDYFCLHCYMNWPAAQSGYLTEHYSGKSAYGKKIWLTEFCAWEYNNGTQSESMAGQTSSMLEKVKFMDDYAGCARYAWFMSYQHTNELPFNSLFKDKNADGTLTSLGEAYMYRDKGKALATLLEKVKNLLDGLTNDNIGTNVGQYPQTAVDALKTAYDSAVTKQDGTEAEISAAHKSLSTALTEFEESKVPAYKRITTELTATNFESSLTKGLAESAFTASGTEDANAAKNAFDGDLKTRWSSDFKDPQWLTINFGKEVEFNTICIKWQDAYSTTFEFQSSTNGTDWTSFLEVDDCKGGNETYKLTLTQKTPYVRFYGKSRATQYGHSFYELGFFNESGE